MSTSGQKRIESTIDTAIDCDEDEVMELAMQAGELLLENGAEIFRVEETMDRICRHYGVESASQFILMNYILATAGEGHGHMFAKVRHIPVNGSHLDKVAAVNQLSREIAEGKYTVSEAYQALETIRRMPDKRKSVLILASGVASGAFFFLIAGIFPLVPGAGVYWTAYYIVTDQLRLAAETGYTAVKVAVAIVLGIVFIFELPQGLFVRLAGNK
ncbi:MAG: threonine/serine exporter family protein [Coprococcus sp.]